MFSFNKEPQNKKGKRVLPGYGGLCTASITETTPLQIFQTRSDKGHCEHELHRLCGSKALGDLRNTQGFGLQLVQNLGPNVKMQLALVK